MLLRSQFQSGRVQRGQANNNNGNDINMNQREMPVMLKIISSQLELICYSGCVNNYLQQPTNFCCFVWGFFTIFLIESIIWSPSMVDPLQKHILQVLRGFKSEVPERGIFMIVVVIKRSLEHVYFYGHFY